MELVEPKHAKKTVMPAIDWSDMPVDAKDDFSDANIIKMQNRLNELEEQYKESLDHIHNLEREIMDKDARINNLKNIALRAMGDTGE